jgi:hypothetical protein
MTGQIGVITLRTDSGLQETCHHFDFTKKTNYNFFASSIDLIFINVKLSKGNFCVFLLTNKRLGGSEYCNHIIMFMKPNYALLAGEC